MWEGDYVDLGNLILKGYGFNLYMMVAKLSVMVVSNISSEVSVSKSKLEKIVN